MSGRVKPIEKFTQAAAKCSVEVRKGQKTKKTGNFRIVVLTRRYIQGAAYGKCIVAEYQNVRKDLCKTEFMRLKDCYLVRNQQNQLVLQGRERPNNCCE